MRSPTTFLQVLIIIGANLLPLALVLSTIVLVIWARRRAAVRRAGVGADAPGCTRCLYLVRGWNSPACPECGLDVRSAGVCIGPRVHLALKLIAGVLMAASVALALGSLLATLLLTTQRSVAAWRLSDAGGAFDIDLRSYNERQKFPQQDLHSTVLTIDPSRSLGGLVVGFDGWSWREAEPATGSTNANWRRVFIGAGDAVPSAQHLADEIAQAAPGVPAPLASAQGAWLRDQIMMLRSRPPHTAVASPAGSLFTMSSAGSASGSGFSRSANALLVALVVLAVTCTGLIIWRRHAPGWRPVFDGEWRGGTGTNTAEIQQSA